MFMHLNMTTYYLIYITLSTFIMYDYYLSPGLYFPKVDLLGHFSSTE